MTSQKQREAGNAIGFGGKPGNARGSRNPELRSPLRPQPQSSAAEGEP
jgi:hypothetical protein